jgi:hypothetical protein
MVGISDRFDGRDGALLTFFAGLGAAIAWVLVYQSGSVWLLQMFTPEALMWACGHGFRHPLDASDGMIDFLLHRRVPAFDCSTIAPNIKTGPPGIFFRIQLYLSLSAAGLWRLLGPSQVALAPLAAFLGAAYAAGGYLLSRLFLGRLFSTISALAIATSPVAIGLMFRLRDFSKGPFFLWTIVLLVLAARVRQQGLALWLALAAGAVAGIGYGFRADLAIMFPLGLIFLGLGRVLRLSARAVLMAAYSCSFLLLALPILTVGNVGNAGSLIMQGATEPFRAFLGLRQAPYALGQAYSDELTLSAIAVVERVSRPDWDSREPAPFYGVSQAYVYSNTNLLRWASNFVADFAVQSLKGAGWILGFPALVAVSRGNPDPGAPLRIGLPVTRWQEPVYSLFGKPWMPIIGFIGIVALLTRVASRCRREALALAVLLIGLLIYPAIQFSVRHIFHLEFIWILALLSLLPAIAEWRRLLSVLTGVAIITASVLGVGALAYLALAKFQQLRLTKEFSALLSLPREPVATESQQLASKGLFVRVPVPAAHAGLVSGMPDSMTDKIATIGLQYDVRAGGERMLMTLTGPFCPAGPTTLEFRYDHRPGVWQPLDFKLTAKSGDMIIFPAFYRSTQSFAGVLIPPSHTRCEVRLARLPLTSSLPFVLTAILPPDWRALPLRKEFGYFDVGPPF